MSIVTKVIAGEEIYQQIKKHLLEAPIMEFRHRGETYRLLYPYQATALKNLGAQLEFYNTNVTLRPELPMIPSSLEITLAQDVEPAIAPEDKEGFNLFVEKLKGILGTK